MSKGVTTSLMTALLFVTCGCKSLHGSFVNGQYFSPDRSFSVNFASPESTLFGVEPARTWDESEGSVTSVYFGSSWGQLRRLDAMHLTHEKLTELENGDRLALLSQIARSKFVPGLRETVADLEVLKERYFPEIQQGTYFIVLCVPKRSNWQSSWTDEKGKRQHARLDDVVAYTMHVDAPFLFITAVSDLPDHLKLNHLTPPEEVRSPEHIQDLQNAAIDFVARVKTSESIRIR